jgi:hypothetical protein
MAEKLHPSDLAAAAAQGVAIALNARKLKGDAVKEELLFSLHHVICGIPQYLYDVTITQGEDGRFSAGSPVQTTER